MEAEVDAEGNVELESDFDIRIEGLFEDDLYDGENPLPLFDANIEIVDISEILCPEAVETAFYLA